MITDQHMSTDSGSLAPGLLVDRADRKSVV